MYTTSSIWEEADYARIATGTRESGEALVRHAGVARGMRVLDLGCGDGTTALPAARLGAHVLGVDLSASAVAAGQQRAAEAGLAGACHLLQGDACDLRGVDSHCFDRVISMFGVMYAARPTEVAREMVRVTRPGGRIVLANWIPRDSTLVARLAQICAAHAPPERLEGVHPMEWGMTTHVIDRFGQAGVAWEGITCEREDCIFEFHDAPAVVAERFLECDGPTRRAWMAATANGRAGAMRSEVVGLFEQQNRSQYPSTTLIPATYLRVTVEL